MKTTHLLPAVVVWLAVCGRTLAQTQPAAAPIDRADNVAHLLGELLLHDSYGPGLGRYRQTRDDVTRRVLDEVDAFVTENFSPSTTSLPEMKARLNVLLNHVPHGRQHASAFSVSLPSGRFLVIGVEVKRLDLPKTRCRSAHSQKRAIGSWPSQTPSSRTGAAFPRTGPNSTGV
jgi:hypothetical protein